jgi:hypothetical protein
MSTEKRSNFTTEDDNDNGGIATFLCKNAFNENIKKYDFFFSWQNELKSKLY